MTANANARTNSHKEGYLSCALFMLNTPVLYALMQWAQSVWVKRSITGLTHRKEAAGKEDYGVQHYSYL